VGVFKVVAAERVTRHDRQCRVTLPAEL
jgi:hypothetical protein